MSRGSFFSSCVPRSLIGDQQELRLVFIGANDTFTAKFFSIVTPVVTSTALGDLGGELFRRSTAVWRH